MTKRLLIVIPAYGSYRAFLKGQATWLVERGWEVHLASCLTGHEVDADVALLHHVDMPRGARPFEILRAACALSRLIRSLRPAVVHAHFSVGMLCLAFVPRINGIRYLGTFQGMRFPVASGLSRSLFKCIECFTILRLRRSWVLSSDDFSSVPKCVQKKLEIQDGYGFGCDIKHFDADRFQPSTKSKLREDLGILEHDFLYIFVGRLTEFKGFLLLLEAFQGLCESTANVHLLILGEVDLQHPLDLPDLDSMDHVHHVGWQDDPAPFLAISDAMVFPSYREGMPVCLMEAISMGLDIVTSKVRGCRDLGKFSGAVLVDHDVASVLEGMREVYLRKKEILPDPRLRGVLDREVFYEAVRRVYEQ